MQMSADVRGVSATRLQFIFFEITFLKIVNVSVCNFKSRQLALTLQGTLKVSDTVLKYVLIKGEKILIKLYSTIICESAFHKNYVHE